ncbi:LytTR family transcriptional regulator DNA-binding domain-containing protein [Marinobacter segnicrescens]|uniref:LytTR family transcriptional regulator DNA-binding domain-containing protein n=1 Tax=Marinobacter segnicrescens TaxID=430453 RepID=UPI003A8FFF80
MPPTFHHSDWAAVTEALLSKPRQQAMDQVLERLGRACSVDRAWIIRYNDAFTHFWNVHEWVRPGVPQYVHDLQGIPVSLGHWLNQDLQQGRTCVINDLREMPRTASALRKEWERQGIRSLLAAPGLWEGRLVLQVGFDCVHEQRAWAPADIELLSAVTQVLTVALYGNRGQAAEDSMDFPPCAPTEPRAVLRRFLAHEAKALEDLLLIRVSGDYSYLRFRDGHEAVELRSLNYWEASLPRELFCRVHRGALVNLREIERLSRSGGRWELYLKALPEPLPVGRRYRDVLKHHLSI